jgi:hypothetical protein
MLMSSGNLQTSTQHTNRAFNISLRGYGASLIWNKLHDMLHEQNLSLHFILPWFLAHLSWKLKWAFLITRCPNHPWVKGIQVCSKEGDSPSPRGDNSRRVKIHWQFLKIFLFRTSRPNSIKLGTNYPWVKGIQVCSNKGPGPLQRGDNRKNGVGSFKNLLLQNHWANFNQT